MASEIRVNKIENRSGLGTVTFADTGVDLAGITTAATLKVGTGATVSSDGDAFFTGVCTATSFVGSGANLTSLPAQATISNNADNRVITGGSGVNLNGESGLTFSSNTLSINTNGSSFAENNVRFQSAGKAYIDHATTGQDIDIRTSVSSSLDTTGITIKSTGNLAFASGKGIDFSADSNASGASSEVLDDYEEGTFTPTMANSITLHSGNDLLSYVKVGHLVHVTGVVRINSSNSSSDIAITNMPFATVNASDQAGNAIGSVSIYDINMNSGYSQVICVMNPNSTQLNVVLQTQSGGQQLGMDGTDNGYVGVSICYRAA